MLNRNPAHFWLVQALVATLLVTVTEARAQEKPKDEPSKSPAISLEPSSGFSGSTVAVSGAGFHKSCGVYLFFGGAAKQEPQGFVGVDRDGSFESPVVIPATAAGRHPVVAQGLRVEDNECSETSGDSARAEFTLLPEPPILTMDAFEGRPGEMVTLEGRGFCTETGCSTVRLMIDGQVVADEIAVRADGTLSVQAQVPAIEAGGEVVIEAVQTMSGGQEIRVVGELTVTVKPNISTEGPQ